MEKLHLNQQPATPTIKPEATPTTKPKATSTSPNAEENTAAATKEENDEAVDGGNAEATPSGHTHQQQQITPDTSIGPLDDSYSATLQELMQQVFTESGGLVRDREHGVVFTRDESIDKMLPRTSPPSNLATIIPLITCLTLLLPPIISLLSLELDVFFQ